MKRRIFRATWIPAVLGGIAAAAISGSAYASEAPFKHARDLSRLPMSTQQPSTSDSQAPSLAPDALAPEVRSPYAANPEPLGPNLDPQAPPNAPTTTDAPAPDAQASGSTSTTDSSSTSGYAVEGDPDGDSYWEGPWDADGPYDPNGAAYGPGEGVTQQAPGTDDQAPESEPVVGQQMVG